MLRVQVLTEDTAPFVAEIIKKIYQKSYSKLHLPTAKEALQEHQAKDNLVALAFCNEEVVGMISLKRSSDSPKVYELGMLSVVQEHRNGQVAKALTDYAKYNFADFVEYDAAYLENVSSHYYTQRKANQNYGIDCAIALGAMPELDTKGRMSFIFNFFEHDKAFPQPIYIPEFYVDDLLLFYFGLKPRTILPFCNKKPYNKKSLITHTHFPTLNLLKASVSNIGEDFLANILQLESYIEQNQVITTLVYLPLSSEYISFAVDVLSDRGFFLGGIMPFWFGCDGLLMQKTSYTDYSNLHIYSKKAKQMLQIIHKKI